MSAITPKTFEKLSFLGLINHPEIEKIEIPIIQRDYAQGRTDKEELRKDFLKSLRSGLEKNPLELDFVYGSIKNKVFQPLDGQQRLTTLFLLHWYIATKEEKLNDHLKMQLNKFTYETRISSREFCTELINKGIVWNEQKLSEIIKDRNWFFISWQKDPTIKSMLTMLDDIHEEFKKKNDLWDKLNKISFKFIVLDNFGLSDDLYIKMNARGKALTEFENFKAKIEQFLNKQSSNTFSKKIDTTWTDLFWNYRNEDNSFDDCFLNFFKTLAASHYSLKNNDIKSENFKKEVDELRDNKLKLSFNKYIELGAFDKDYFDFIEAILDKLSQKEGLNKFLNSEPFYIDEEKLFKDVLKNDLVYYADRVILYAFYQYLAVETVVDTEKLTHWIRIIRNLVEGTRPYLFNNATDFANSLFSIKKLIEHRNNIVEFFANLEKFELPGFTEIQVKEEHEKAKLILKNEEWKKAIVEIENHNYFNGQIGFLIDWCFKNDEYDLNIFHEYSEKAISVFCNDGLNNKFENYLFERALLATGDYLLKKGSNYSFVVNNDRDISWKRLLRDANDKRNFLKQLLNKIDPKSIVEDLQNIINCFEDTNDWRYNFIKQPEIIKVSGAYKLIRWSDEKNILILKKTTTSGYHVEYYSYSLCLNLKGKVEHLNDENLERKSVSDIKKIEINNEYVLSFENGKYKINHESSNDEFFDNQDSVINYLKDKGLYKTDLP